MSGGVLVEICDGDVVVSCDPNLTVVVTDWDKLSAVAHYQPEDYTALADRIRALPGVDLTSDEVEARAEAINDLDSLRGVCANWHGTAH